jgi:hypothetical protein
MPGAVVVVMGCAGGGYLAVRQEALQRQPFRLLRGELPPTHPFTHPSIYYRHKPHLGLHQTAMHGCDLT